MHSIDTSTIRKDQRFDFWREEVCTRFLKAEAFFEGPKGEFQGALSNNPVGNMLVSDLASTCVRWQRRPSDVRAEDKDVFILSQLIDGRGELTQFDRRMVQGPGDFVLYDSAAPLEYSFEGNLRLLRIPRADLESRILRPHDLAAVSFGKSDRLNTVVGRMLEEILHLDLSNQVEGPVGTRVAHSLLDLVVAFFDLYSDGRSEGLDGADLRLDRVLRFAMANLGDTELSPERLAKAGAMSVRSLNRAFASRGMTPMKWVWEQRLNKAHRELESGHLRVTEVAFSNGFSELGHFSRSFKAQFGVSPSAWRDRTTKHKGQGRFWPNGSHHQT